MRSVGDFIGYFRASALLGHDGRDARLREALQAAFDGRIPNEAQASTYRGVTHYLKAIAAIRTDEGEAVVRQMRNTSINDFELKNVRIHPGGQVMRPLHAARIKGAD
ncbi:ABC transporter substrate-binding protein [Bradyrhizobium yuanmingense]|uniref:ABC transporter substrate-binding protein n=1 Tax=Bradyrhizobium yuanmingense TaxID=108015 RepID=UPI001FD57DB0|nr:ABC transporter substrate-binding protein [Bradyrhizobium yuanmingense]